MWWSRISVLFITAALLAACGFHPLYEGGRKGEAATELAAVKIEPIADRSGQILRNHLLDLLNPYGQPAQPQYILKVILSEGASGLAVRKSEFATRANLQISAQYRLQESRSREVLYTGTTTITGGYNILSSEVSTLASEQDVRERVIGQIAEDLQTRLSAYFRLNPEQREALRRNARQLR